MTYTAKDFIVACIILIIVAVVIWYRNAPYDRFFTSILIVIALIDLVLYACYNSINPSTAGKTVVVLLCVLIVVISVATYLHVGGLVWMFTSVIAVSLLITRLVEVIYEERDEHLCFVPLLGRGQAHSRGSREDGTCPVWMKRDKSQMFDEWPILCIVVVASLFSLIYYGCGDATVLYFVALYVVVILLYCSLVTSHLTLGSTMCYMLSGVALVIWFAGMLTGECV